MKICVIPARGGSKRIPGKNIKSFAGQPMISYAIRAAIASNCFDRIVVSTDSEEIAAVAREHGAETPFLRPSDISGDHASTAEVLSHALAWFREHDTMPTYLCNVYPTAVFLQAKYLREGLAIIEKHRVAAVVSVTTFAFPIFRSFKLTEDGHLAMFWPEHELTRSQDLPEAYHSAGQFSWLDAAKFEQEPRFYTPDAMPVVLPRYLVQDIDTPEDWQTAERMYRAMEGT